MKNQRRICGQELAIPAKLVGPSSKSSVDPEELNRRLEKVLLDQKLDDLELEVEYLYWTDERLGLV